MKLILLAMLVVSCSFKPQGKDNGTKLSNTLEVQNMDSDGDGISDLDERTAGTNPYLADLPSFQGDLFEDLKINLSMFRAENNDTQSVSFSVSKLSSSENGVPYEQRDFLSRASNFYNEAVSRNVRSRGLNTVHFTNSIPDANEYLSPPRMNDFKLFPYTEKMLRLSRTHRFEEIEILLSGSLNWKSNLFKTYGELVIDLFYFDENEQKFLLIDSKDISGAYEFNQTYKIGLSFHLNESDLVKKIANGGGRFLFAKIRDFKIYDNGRFFQEMLGHIKKKSILLSVTNFDSTDTAWIGVNGGHARLNDILSRFTNNFKISSNEVLSINGKAATVVIERDPYEQSRTIKSKWIIGTKEIQGNLFSYNFAAGDSIHLNLISQSDKFDLIPRHRSELILGDTNRVLFVDKILKSAINDYKLTIFPKSFIGNIQIISKTDTCLQDGELCFNFSLKEQTLEGLNATPLFQGLYLTINGKRFSANHLLKDGTLLVRQKYTNAFELKLDETKFKPDNNLTIEVFYQNQSPPLCEGVMYCHRYDSICLDTYRTQPPTCEDGDKFGLIDNTKKLVKPLRAEAIISVEYL